MHYVKRTPKVIILKGNGRITVPCTTKAEAQRMVSRLWNKHGLTAIVLG